MSASNPFEGMFDFLLHPIFNQKPPEPVLRFAHRNKEGGFTYMHGGGWSNDRWITHDPNRSFAGEFKTEEEAADAIHRWNEHDGAAVVVEWEAPPEDADDSDRGTYTVSVRDTRFRKTVCSMEEAARVAMKLRDAIAENGIVTMRNVLDSLN